MSSFSNWTHSPQKLLPAAAAGVSVTPNAGAFVNSDWSAITTGLGSPIAVAGLIVTNAAVVADYRVDLGTGAIASEVVKGTLSNHMESDAGGAFMEWKTPIYVPGGTRIAVRMRKSGTDVNAWAFKMVYYEIPSAPVAWLNQTIRPPMDARRVMRLGRRGVVARDGTTPIPAVVGGARTCGTQYLRLRRRF
jgi:hypothetical protein